MRIDDTYEIMIDGTVINRNTGRVLKTCLVGSGYKALRLGVGRKFYIHNLVANAFLPAPTEEGLVIDHIDRNKLNNHASNLRWVSKSINSINRSVEVKPRASNKSGHHHIKVILAPRQINPTFAVVFNTKDFKHYSAHKTLEDAIEKRDSILENVQTAESPAA